MRRCAIAKRFTDSEKWKKGWFRKLNPVYKCLWVYICDNCNMAGIWDVDFELAEIFIGAKLEPQEIKEVFKKQYQELNSGSKWFIKDFISFQYGELIENNNFHKSVVALLKKAGVFEGLISPSRGALVKEKVKDKDKGVVKGESDTDKIFEHFCLKYKEVFNKEYVVNFGKDKKLIKDLLKIVKEDELTSLINKFFESDEEFIQKAGYTLGVFKSQINKLRSKKTSTLTFKKE